jgi:FkbM family methyltransferase
MLPEIKIHTTMTGIRYALFAQKEIISDEIRKNNHWAVYNLEIADIVLSQKKNLRVIDVGSGFGAFTVPLAIKYLDNHIFDAFEPVPAINSQLNANILLNMLDNVRSHRVAIGDKNEDIDSFIFDLSSTNHGAFSISRESYINRGIPIPNESDIFEVRTLDRYRFGKVGLIKITVSGTELDVLVGAEQTIAQNNLPPLMIESWDAEWNLERRSKVLELLTKFGYPKIIEKRNFIFALNDFELVQKVQDRLDKQLPGSLVVFK